MLIKTKLPLALALVASAFAFNATCPRLFAQNEEQELPLVLGADDEQNAENADDSQEIANNDEEEETLPPPTIIEESNALEDDELVLTIPGDSFEGELGEETLTEEQMLQISNQPLFREFATTIDELAPLPSDIELHNLNVPGADLILPNRPSVPQDQIPQTTLEDATRQLDEALDLGNVDINALKLNPKARASFEQLDREIKRLCPLWIDAELNRATIGRRELNWKQSRGTLYATDEPKPIDALGYDWALAPDAPFFFQVVDSLSGEVFYTKAGDFEQINPLDILSPALVREESVYNLSLMPGKVNPTGNAERVKILKNGIVQGTKADGKLVTDVELAIVPLFVFDNPARLESEDGVLFKPTQSSGEPRQSELSRATKIGVNAGKILPSNGKPEEIFARIVVLCKSKKRLAEIYSQPTLQ